jgi:hypothetical protein
MPYVAIFCRVQLHQLYIDADFLLGIKGVVDHLEQLLKHVICGWSVSPLDSHLHHLEGREVIDAIVVDSIGRS